MDSNLNQTSLSFCADNIESSEFEILSNDVHPSPRAIIDFPPTKDLTDVGSWFGLVNEEAYAFGMANCMLPFCELLKPGTHFKWNEELQELFKESKCNIPNVMIFDSSGPTCLATDWYWFLIITYALLMPSCCPTGWKIRLVEN